MCYSIDLNWDAGGYLLYDRRGGADLLVFLGFLSLLQLTILPGFLCLRALRLQTQGFLQPLLYTFGLSLLANYLLVYALTGAHIYSTPVFYWVLILEGAAYVRLLARGDLGVYAVPSKETLDRYRQPWVWLVALPALAALLGLAYLCYWNFGSVFIRGDDIVSWDRWAVEWSQNRFSDGSGYYPQLFPMNWSIPYIMMQNVDLKMFAKAIMPLFSLGIALLFLDLFQKSGEAAWLLGLSCYAVLLNYLFVPGFIASGYVEIANAFFAFLTYYACVQAAEGPPDRSGRALLLVIAFASTTLLVKQGGVYIFIWAFCWLAARCARRAPGASWRLAAFALLLALALNWWFVMRQWGMLRGLETNNLAYLTRDIHAGRTYGQRWTFALHMLEVVRSPGLERLFWVAAVSTLLSVFHRRGRFVLLTIAAPFYILWALLFSYEPRTLAMELPFAGYCCGCGLDVAFGFGARLIRSISSKPLRLSVAFLEFLLAGGLVAWVLHPAVGPSGNPDFIRIMRDPLIAAAYFLPVLILSARHLLPVRVPIPRTLVVAIFCAITIIPAAVVDQDRLIHDQVEQLRQVGFPSLDLKIYQYAAAHPLEGTIVTDYWFLDFAPDLRIHSVTSLLPATFGPDSRQACAKRPGARYLLTSSDRFPASTRAWMEHNGFEMVLTEAGLQLVRFP